MPSGPTSLPAVLQSLGWRRLGGAGGRPVETAALRENLAARGYTDDHVRIALRKLQAVVDGAHAAPYEAGLHCYQLLRYGVPVQVAIGRPHETVHLVDWAQPQRNDYAYAEQVAIGEPGQRRLDLVLYLNGLAVAVIELERSAHDVADGVRRLIEHQQAAPGCFGTVQLLLAGNPAQGLRYGTTGTPEQFFVRWKHDNGALDGALAQLCGREQLLDLVRHFVIFDGGRKKLPRQHQFIAVKKAQERLARREGGVIWHTQGSGKSILMVLLAKWLLEHDARARILVVSDRDELDQQIDGVMKNAGLTGAGAPSSRITSRAELVHRLGAAEPRLLCALIHKFDAADLSGRPPHVQGRFVVFVDECHRSQGGELNRQMKRWLEGAVFIGFTGTPLLRRDRPMTREVFGSNIHTYKFHEAVADEVVLDLKYEARDVPQRLGSRAAVDRWFAQATRGLNGAHKALLRRRWATMETLMSAAERKQRIIASIIGDFSLQPRLANGRGTAILVAASIRDACHYFRLFQETAFGPYCGIVTSFEPRAHAIAREPEGSDERYKFETYVHHVLAEGQGTQQYESEIKRRFRDEPQRCKLLIVVGKLLTGFDAPSCSVVYLDSELRDHHLFQAICRTNRLDGDDKACGRIVDFKGLLHDVQQAFAVYSCDDLDVDAGSCADHNVHLKDWRSDGRRRLEQAREDLRHLCEPVEPPRGVEQFLRHFGGDAARADSLLDTQARRGAFYKAVARLVRAYAELARHLGEVGYAPGEAGALQREVAFYSEVRASIERHAGEEFDIRPFEADMRRLIDTYVQAGPARTLGAADGLPLMRLIVETGIRAAIERRLNATGRLSRRAIAQTLINQVRKSIVRDRLTDPRFYDRMSSLLDELIALNCADTAAYDDFLRKAEALIRRMDRRDDDDAHVPALLRGRVEAAVIFRNLGSLPSTRFKAPTDDETKAALALAIDRAVRENAPAGWVGDPVREAQVINALFPILDRDSKATRMVFDIVTHQPGYQ